MKDKRAYTILWIAISTLKEQSAICCRPSNGNVSETGRRLLTEEPVVRDIMYCATFAGNAEALPISSN